MFWHASCNCPCKGAAAAGCTPISEREARERHSVNSDRTLLVLASFLKQKSGSTIVGEYNDEKKA